MHCKDCSHEWRLHRLLPALSSDRMASLSGTGPLQKYAASTGMPGIKLILSYIPTHIGVACTMQLYMLGDITKD